MTVPQMKEFLDKPLFPNILQFETNTYCNARCLMCPHDRMRRRGRAKWSFISKLIREASQHSVEVVSPFLMQEPLLEPRLVAVLANIRQRMPRTTISLYSNLSVLPEPVMQRIVDYELLDHLHISFYGPTEELYRKWQPPLKRETTVANIKAFHKYRQGRKAAKPRTTLHVLSVPEICNAATGYSDVLPYVDEIGNVQFDTFHGDVPDMAGDQTKYLGVSPAPRTPCQRLWYGMTVLFNGDVVPCCIDYNGEQVLGNAAKDTLASIWMNKNYMQFRRLHRQGRWNDIPLCRGCVVHEYQFSTEWVKYWRRNLLAAKPC